MNARRKIILLYHRVACLPSDPWSLCVSPQHFEEHLRVIGKYVPVKVSEFLEMRDGTRSDIDCAVALTFDDGYADNFEQAAPLLAHYQIPATFFVTTGYVGAGREFWWDELERFVFETALPALAATLHEHAHTLEHSWSEREARESLFFQLYGELQIMSHQLRLALLNEWLEGTGQSPVVRKSHRIMTEQQISLLATNGLFEIGSHTQTHPRLSAQSPAAQKQEILGSKTWLEALLQRPVSGFSYPFGAPHHHDAKAVQFVQDAGFRYAVTTTRRPVNAADSHFQLPRFNVTDMSGEEFERHIFQ